VHKSVLLNEVIDYLSLKTDSFVVDCTLGYAGHSSCILKEIKKGFLFAFDQDSDAINYSKEKLSEISDNFEIINTNFVNLKSELNKRGVNYVDGILFDLGVSSPQLDNKDRGFSFHKDSILDMRMDKNSKLTAHYVVNNYSYEDLVNILYKYGEEKYAKNIANAIVKYREKKNIDTTLELVEIIKNSVPIKYTKDHHPARKTFQAIRIEVNNELEVFEKALTDALDLLNVGGRICVITFHSLEDKICKKIFKEKSSVREEFKNMPIIPLEYEPKFKIIANISPKEEEISENNRSRSSRLRVIERIR